MGTSRMSVTRADPRARSLMSPTARADGVRVCHAQDTLGETPGTRHIRLTRIVA